MRTFWEAASAVLLILAFGSFITMISMSWWPSIPSSPRPTERRVHVGAGFFGIIQYFADPFDYKRRHHRLQPAPPWQHEVGKFHRVASMWDPLNPL